MIICEDLHKSYRIGHGEKEVLKGVDLTIRPGDKIGLLGLNGAGKTTLIKLIGGVELPTSGRVSRKMSCSWPLGFNGGFQGSLTGYDNARFIARIYDQDYRELRDFVEDFTELGKQLQMPVKTYSSGMRARLAFALSLAIEFDCYLIDEVIMVGDHNFQQKCYYELFEKRADRSLLLASHNSDSIRNFCNRAIILVDGYGTMYDDVETALGLYSAFTSTSGKLIDEKSPAESEQQPKPQGNPDNTINGVRLIIRGDSMVSGFEDGALRPVSCDAPWTLPVNKSLVGVGTAIASRLPALVMALPGLSTALVEEWFNSTKLWNSTPTIFWFGTADARFDIEAIVSALMRMTRAMQADWWVLPVMPSRLLYEAGDTAHTDQCNALLQAFAGERFVDPIRALYGAGCLPRSELVDVIHPSETAARAIAEWLIEHTIGAERAQTTLTGPH